MIIIILIMIHGGACTINAVRVAEAGGFLQHGRLWLVQWRWVLVLVTTVS